jgi:hypothetical protein
LADVIDVEIALRSVSCNEAGTNAISSSADDIHVLAEAEEAEDVTSPPKEDVRSRQDRLDAATLEDRDGSLWIVFHEAKHFANSELRAGPSREPPVSRQVARYRSSIKQYTPDITSSYREVCQALVRLHEMRIKASQKGDAAAAIEKAKISALIVRVAAGEALHVDQEPRLIVFGFEGSEGRSDLATPSPTPCRRVRPYRLCHWQSSYGRRSRIHPPRRAIISRRKHVPKPRDVHPSLPRF